MRIRDLIDKLEELYREEMQQYDVIGEPEITIDVFKPTDDGEFRQYAGFHTGDILITRSSDGVYPILSAFAEDYERPEK